MESVFWNQSRIASNNQHNTVDGLHPSDRSEWLDALINSATRQYLWHISSQLCGKGFGRCR